MAAAAAPGVRAEDTTVQAWAVRYYTTEHDVSEKEALRRLELQDATMPSMGKVTSILGSRYGGAWFDANDDGRLKIGVVGLESGESRAALEDVRSLLLSKGALGESEFVDVAVSYDELVSTSQRLAKTAGADGLSASYAVDVESNSVVIKRDAGKGQDLFDEARLATDVPVREKIIEGFSPEKTCASGAPFCDRPLRGGVEMSSGGGACTAGFNVTSRSDGKRYMLTAGHCKQNTTWSTKTNLYGQWLEIGPEHNMQFWYSGRDAGIIRDKTPSYWQQSPFPTSTIWIDDIPTVHAQNNNYVIQQEGNAIEGTVVCITGGGGYNGSDRQMFWHGTPYQSYTWCGGVIDASATVVYDADPAQTVYNLVVTNICTWPGMSGGPVFKWNVAYGIWSGKNCSGGYQEGYYYPSILAENDLNVDIVH